MGQSITNAAGALYMDGNRMLIIFNSPSVSTLVNLCVNIMWDHKSQYQQQRNDTISQFDYIQPSLNRLHGKAAEMILHKIFTNEHPNDVHRSPYSELNNQAFFKKTANLSIHVLQEYTFVQFQHVTDLENPSIAKLNKGQIQNFYNL